MYPPNFKRYPETADSLSMAQNDTALRDKKGKGKGWKSKTRPMAILSLSDDFAQ